MRRVNGLLREVLAEAVGRELADPRLGFLTITDVEATSDLREATVYYTTLRDEDEPQSQAALESARGVLQGRVAAELRSRNTPQLRFAYDRTRARAESVTRLIDRIASERDDAP